MFGRRIELFRLLGFSIRIDASWLLVFLLVSWSLASGTFPMAYEGRTTATYWLMGFCGALGLFASVVFHELAHSIVARHFGMPITGITLFLFGGVAELGDTPPTPRAEVLTGVAGPVSSLLLGGAVLFGAWLAEITEWPDTIVGVTAAMPSGTGINILADRFPARVFDVGIAEQHAVTFAAGMAAGGLKPFCAIYSTFLQRGYDVA